MEPAPVNPRKRPLGIDVLHAAQQRIKWVFDRFERVYLAGPSGKDSGVMMHLTCLAARRRGRKVGVLYVDLEAQYRMTIEHIESMFGLYQDVIEPHWVALPLHLRNAVSQLAPYWICWDPEAKERWVRQPPERAETAFEAYPFYRPPWEAHGYRGAMEFEEFVDEFGKWYGQGADTCCLVGIRSDESLNRWRAIDTPRESRVDGRPWTTRKSSTLVAAYPIYDWQTEDVWTYHGRTGLVHNRLYDHMHKAGLSVDQMRICQPYGDDQRRGLAMWHVIEPETWAKVVARVAGARHGALYAGKRGNILGNGRVTLPDTHPTWESYVTFLLSTLPTHEREHYENKIAVFRRWWREKRDMEIVDEAPYDVEARKEAPTWRRVAKTRSSAMASTGLGTTSASATRCTSSTWRPQGQSRAQAPLSRRDELVGHADEVAPAVFLRFRSQRLPVEPKGRHIVSARGYLLLKHSNDQVPAEPPGYAHCRDAIEAAWEGPWPLYVALDNGKDPDCVGGAIEAHGRSDDFRLLLAWVRTLSKCVPKMLSRFAHAGVTPSSPEI